MTMGKEIMGKLSSDMLERALVIYYDDQGRMCSMHSDFDWADFGFASEIMNKIARDKLGDEYDELVGEIDDRNPTPS